MADLKVEPDGPEIKFGPYITEDVPVPGTLRLYGPDGTYKEIDWNVGSVIAFGHTQTELYNLNTSTSSMFSMFRNKSNVDIPVGITFENTTDVSYMFYGASNITIPFTATFEKTTNWSAAFYTSKNVTVPKETIPNILNGTTYDSTFFSTDFIKLMPGYPEIDVTFPNATNLVSTFQGNSGVTKIKVTAPKAANCASIFKSMSNLVEAYIEAPVCTTVSGAGIAAGGNWGGFGLNNNLRKLTTIMPKLSDGTYFAQSSKGCIEWYGDISSVTTLNGGFDDWKMDKASIHRLSENLPAYTSGSHPVRIGMDKNLQNDPEVLADLEAITRKGWTLTRQWN